jgi:hypothetical protein
MPLNGAFPETRIPESLRNNNDTVKSKQFHSPTVFRRTKRSRCDFLFRSTWRNQKGVAESLGMGAAKRAPPTRMGRFAFTRRRGKLYLARRKEDCDAPDPEL